jgi:low molecular weight protein-tyrosine phosphatase
LRIACNGGDAVSDLLTAIRHAPDRLLHAGRHAAAIANVRSRGWIPNVLVVCHGNICRSPYAAGLLRRELAPAGISVESAGFIGPGRTSPFAARREAAEHGVDLIPHRSRLLTPQMVNRATLVLVMDAHQARAMVRLFGKAPADVLLLGDLDPARGEKRTIRDPIDQPSDVYRSVYGRIDRCALALVHAMATPGSRSDAPDAFHHAHHDVPPLHG